MAANQFITFEVITIKFVVIKLSAKKFAATTMELIKAQFNLDSPCPRSSFT